MIYLRTLIALFLLASAPRALAQEEEEGLEDEFALLEDAETVELAARHRQKIGMSPSAVTVITREDIMTSGAATVTDLLRLVPGMDVVISSRAQSSITSRLNWTYEGNQYLVMVDGRDAMLEILGFVMWEVQPIFLEEVERIEIIRGPGSALYGANAVGGVVNITTRGIADRQGAWAQLQGGEVGTLSAEAGASVSLGDWGFSLGAGAQSAAAFYDPRANSCEGYKFRALVERRFSESRRLRIDATVGRMEGLIPSTMGIFLGGQMQSTLRLAYHSDSLRGHLYWVWVPTWADFDAPLEYAGILLAEFPRLEMDGHVLDADVQWTLPELWEPLMLMAGVNARGTWTGSDQYLDAETFADPASPRYHKPGADFWEGRAGAFVHAELAPAEFLTVTGSLRFDYNTTTDVFLSPRLAAVFMPAEDHYIRLGVARAFRKPSLMETQIHFLVDFPDTSPITGDARQTFLEFMTRVAGNPDLHNETLTAFELGYHGRFLDGRLMIGLDLYYNIYSDLSEVITRIIPDERGLPDLEKSSVTFEVVGGANNIIGSELTVRYNPTPKILLSAAWSTRQVLEFADLSPKNQIMLGGRFRTDWGLLGSLYAFSRSDFREVSVQNPQGLMAPLLHMSHESVVLVLGRLGWAADLGSGAEIELGARLFLPISPFQEPYFRYFERSGGYTPAGRHFGSDQLSRMLTFYLRGVF
jgi:iron complex outermembrane receptor protein